MIPPFLWEGDREYLPLSHINAMVQPAMTQQSNGSHDLFMTQHLLTLRVETHFKLCKCKKNPKKNHYWPINIKINSTHIKTTFCVNFKRIILRRQESYFIEYITNLLLFVKQTSTLVPVICTRVFLTRSCWAPLCSLIFKLPEPHIDRFMLFDFLTCSYRLSECCLSGHSRCPKYGDVFNGVRHYSWNVTSPPNGSNQVKLCQCERQAQVYRLEHGLEVWQRNAPFTLR